MTVAPRRSPYGERGLKFLGGNVSNSCPRRSPYGERGLKSPMTVAPLIAMVALLTESVD